MGHIKFGSILIMTVEVSCAYSRELWEAMSAWGEPTQQSRLIVTNDPNLRSFLKPATIDERMVLYSIHQKVDGSHNLWTLKLTNRS